MKFKTTKWQITLRGLAFLTLLVVCGIAPLAYLSLRAKRERVIAEQYAATLSYDFQYDEEEDEYHYDATPPGPWLLRRLFDETMFAKTRMLKIQKNPNLTNLDRLRELSGLKTVLIFDCPQLKNLDGLANSQLKILCVDKCPQLQNVDPLQGMTTLKYINLWRCPALENVDALANCNLIRFNLRECPLVNNIDSLEGHTDLRFCFLDGCHGLKHFNGLMDHTMTTFSITASDQLLTQSVLSGLGRVRQMGLTDCNLQSLEQVWKHFNVKTMNLYRCPNLVSLKGIGETICMEKLTLSKCPSLTSLNGLQNSKAEIVYIFHCDALTDIKALDAMPNLKHIHIGNCPQVDPVAMRAIEEKTDQRRKAATEQLEQSPQKRPTSPAKLGTS